EIGHARAELVREPGDGVRLVDDGAPAQRPGGEHGRRRDVAADAEHQIDGVAAELLTRGGHRSEQAPGEGELPEQTAARVLEGADRPEVVPGLRRHPALEPLGGAVVDHLVPSRPQHVAAGPRGAHVAPGPAAGQADPRHAHLPGRPSPTAWPRPPRRTRPGGPPLQGCGRPPRAARTAWWRRLALAGSYSTYPRERSSSTRPSPAARDG